MSSESTRTTGTGQNPGGRSSDAQSVTKAPSPPRSAGERPQKWRQEGPYRVYGPYPKRDGPNIYLREVLYDEDGKRVRERYVGKVGRVDVDTVHVEGDVPTSLIDDVAHAIIYVEQANLSKRRIARPIKRLLRHFGLQHYTDEWGRTDTHSATPQERLSGDKSMEE